MDPDRMDQLSADDRDVRHGADDESRGFRRRIYEAKRCDNRMSGAVSDHACPCFRTGNGPWRDVFCLA